MSIQETAIAAINEQQVKVKINSPQWVVAEQLKDICRAEPKSAELIAGDIGKKGMDITAAEKKIKAYADSHKTGNFAFVPPREADRILREFYGLGPPPWEAGGETAPEPQPAAPNQPDAATNNRIDLAALWRGGR